MCRCIDILDTFKEKLKFINIQIVNNKVCRNTKFTINKIQLILVNSDLTKLLLAPLLNNKHGKQYKELSTLLEKSQSFS